MHINSDTTLGHSRVQNNEAKESNGHLHTFSKKEHNDDSKDGVRMIEIRENYYSSKRYEVSDSYYFDNRLADLFDSESPTASTGREQEGLKFKGQVGHK